ncbi:MAG: tetratricopeptide repeat protein [Bacteroidetes bacterium]|nr:tetratricopeptide repeat protein [Bacteroidota bacterium]
MKSEETLLKTITLAEEALIDDNYAKAESLCKEVLEATESGDYPMLRARALIKISVSMRIRGQVKNAFPCINEALELCKFHKFKELQETALSSIGNMYIDIADYSAAIETSLQSLKIAEELGNKKRIGGQLCNIGLCYDRLADLPRALEYYQKALIILREIDYKPFIIRTSANIGNVYKSLGDFKQSLEYGNLALFYAEQIDDKSSIEKQYGNLSNLYNNMGDYTRALEYINKALALAELLQNKHSIAGNLSNLGNLYNNISNNSRALEYQLASLEIYEELGDIHSISICLGNIGNTYKYLNKFNLALEFYLRALTLCQELGRKNGIALCYARCASIYGYKEFDGYNPHLAEEYLFLAETLNIELGTKPQNKFVYKSLGELYEHQNRLPEAIIYIKKYYILEMEIQSDEAIKQANISAYERQLAETEKSHAIERALATATNEILANILPPNITERLLKGEKKIADTFQNVSVLFTDIVGFTQLSSKLPAGELIDILDIVFTRFDMICKKYGLEKIKTIGDAYMAVCGAPIAVENHAERTALAALEMLEDFSMEQRFSVLIDLGFRIGLHSGNVVAGIIGENKYSYDLWGDAVNTASRMESHGEAGKIHVSEEFVRHLNHRAPTQNLLRREGFASSFSFSLGEEGRDVVLVERGEIDIKGKGMMKTYFLEKI